MKQKYIAIFTLLSIYACGAPMKIKDNRKDKGEKKPRIEHGKTTDKKTYIPDEILGSPFFIERSEMRDGVKTFIVLSPMGLQEMKGFPGFNIFSKQVLEVKYFGAVMFLQAYKDEKMTEKIGISQYSGVIHIDTTYPPFTHFGVKMEGVVKGIEAAKDKLFPDAKVISLQIHLVDEKNQKKAVVEFPFKL